MPILRIVLLCCILIYAGLMWQVRTPVSVSRYDLGSNNITGTVASVPMTTGCLHSLRLHLKPSVLGFTSLQLTDYHCGAQYDVNQRIRLPAKLTVVSNRDQMLYAQAKARPTVITEGDTVYNLLALRAYLYHKIVRHVYWPTTASLLAALSLGIKDNHYIELQPLFTLTGVSHLFAISGLHLGLILWFAYSISRYVVAPVLWLNWESSCYSVLWLLLTGIMVLAYSGLIGGAPPTLRATAFILIAGLGMLLRQPLRADWLLAIVFFGFILCHPSFSRDIRFTLSFFAIFLLVLCADYLQRWPHRWQQYLSVTGLFYIGFLPILLFYFHVWVYLSPLYNLITVPLVEMIVLPATLITLCLPDQWVGYIFVDFLEPLCQFMLTLLQAVAYQPSLHGYFSLDALGLALWLILLLLWLFPFSWGLKITSLVCGLVWLFSQPSSLSEGQARVTLFDVGQGLSLFIQTKHHTLLYDTGPQFYNGRMAFSGAPMNWLRASGIQQLDTLVISHGDNDHIGGYTAIMHAYPPKMIYTSALNRLPRALPCLAGRYWRWDGVTFTFLYPDRDFLGLRNNSSCVLKVTTAHDSLLLTGDIEALAEQILTRFHYGDLPSTLLQVPHHGSDSSSTPDFINAVHPTVAWIGVGRHNRFGLPKRKVIQRYRQLHSVLADTAMTGQITADLT